MNKVFGIGMGRTATKSLTKALEILGINVIHYPNDQETLLHIQNGFFKLPILETCDGITDTVAVPYFAQFDKHDPDSKFILTVRELESWLVSSCKDHGGISEDPLDPNAMSELRRFYRAACWGSYRFNRDRYAFVFEQHNKNVMDHFKDRPDDLLIMDIVGGEGWEALCPFLGVDIPDVPFPTVGTPSSRPAEPASEPQSGMGRIAQRAARLFNRV